MLCTHNIHIHEFMLKNNDALKWRPHLFFNGAENGQFQSISEEPTLKPNSSMIGTCQGQHSFTLAYQTPFQNRRFRSCVASPSKGRTLQRFRSSRFETARDWRQQKFTNVKGHSLEEINLVCY